MDNSISPTIRKYYKAYLEWKTELKKYEGKEWPYAISRNEVDGLIRVWRGYLRMSGLLN